MSYPCEIKVQTAQPTLCIRKRAAVQDLPQVVGAAYAALMQYLGDLGEQPAGPPYVAYHNMDMQDLSLEIGVPVIRWMPAVAPIEPRELPAGQVATCLYTGPYQEIGKGYEALTALLAAQGREATGVAYEYYLNDPQQTPPEQLLTQIVMPLK